jgi:peptidyl-prolyl cis-trans isomerase B (cyclophilin B)
MEYVRLTTALGEIVLELNREAAPATVENFVRYVKDGHYDGTIFHRVIAGFMIQGGGLDGRFSERETRPPIDNEARNGLLNARYAVAMARTMDPHSATSQFFINTRDNDFLNFTGEGPHGWGYAVFGRVAEGQETVDRIEEVGTTSWAGHDDVPFLPGDDASEGPDGMPGRPVVIEKAEVLENYAPSLVG